MSENDGERELVLGNKQLLTIFFVAVLLCGVFFAMGYVVGGNSAKSSLTAGMTTTDSTTTPGTEGKREQPAVPTDSGSATPAPQDNAGQLPTAEPQMADNNPAAAGAQPVATPPAATPAPNPVTVAPGESPRAIAAAAKAAAAAAPAAGDMPVSTPESGASYMQIAATARPTAEDLVRTMREKKLPAILAVSSKPALFRVLVGPYRSTYSLSQAKIELKSLGFQDPLVYKQP